jgi:hypothetical protein
LRLRPPLLVDSSNDEFNYAFQAAGVAAKPFCVLIGKTEP